MQAKNKGIRHAFAVMHMAVRTATQSDAYKACHAKRAGHCSVTANVLIRMGLQVPANIAGMLQANEHPEYILAASLAASQQGE